MGPSLPRDVFRYASRRAGCPSRKGRRFRRSGVSVNPPGPRVKMPHGGPAGWRSVEEGQRSVSGRIVFQLLAGSASSRGWTWVFTPFQPWREVCSRPLRTAPVPPLAACRGGFGNRPGRVSGVSHGHQVSQAYRGRWGRRWRPAGPAGGAAGPRRSRGRERRLGSRGGAVRGAPVGRLRRTRHADAASVRHADGASADRGAPRARVRGPSEPARRGSRARFERSE